MIKIIETNLSLYDDGTVADHQSRVVEVESWDEYIEEIRLAKRVDRHSCLGAMIGGSLPKNCKVKNVKSDDFHLSCDVIDWLGRTTKKLVYKI